MSSGKIAPTSCVVFVCDSLTDKDDDDNDRHTKYSMAPCSSNIDNESDM